MDHKPLLAGAATHLRPGGRPGEIRRAMAPSPPRHRLRPTPYLVAGIPTTHPRVYKILSPAVTRYPANSIVVVGSCPVCRVGILEYCFTFLGIFFAFVLFPFWFIHFFA